MKVNPDHLQNELTLRLGKHLPFVIISCKFMHDFLREAARRHINIYAEWQTNRSDRITFLLADAKTVHDTLSWLYTTYVYTQHDHSTHYRHSRNRLWQSVRTVRVSGAWRCIAYPIPFFNTHKAAVIIKYKNTQSTMNRKYIQKQ